MPARFENIQALRGVAALLVVFCHLQVIEQKYGHGAVLLPAWLDYGKASVDLFFAISGFVIATVTRGQFQSPRAAGHFLLQRITRIYPPYWFYSFMVLVLWVYKPEMVNSAQGNRVNLWASFLLFPQELLPLLMVGWTLIHEMYFYVATTVVMPMVRERAFPAVLVLWALIIILGQIYCAINPDANHSPVLQVAFHPLNLEFIGGAAMALLLHHNIRGSGYAIMVTGCAALLLSSIWLDTRQPELDTEGWWRVLFFGIPALLMVHGAASAEISGKVCFPRIMRSMGNASYSIYLTHLLVLSAIGRIWMEIATPNIIGHAAVLMLMVVASISVGFISYRWVEMPFLKVIRNRKIGCG